MSFDPKTYKSNILTSIKNHTIENVDFDSAFQNTIEKVDLGWMWVRVGCGVIGGGSVCVCYEFAIVQS